MFIVSNNIISCLGLKRILMLHLMKLNLRLPLVKWVVVFQLCNWHWMCRSSLARPSLLGTKSFSRRSIRAASAPSRKGWRPSLPSSPCPAFQNSKIKKVTLCCPQSIISLLKTYAIKGEPELTDPFNLLINVKLRML